MEKKRKKMPVKSRLRVWCQVCALVCALVVVLAAPMVAGASEYPTINDYRFVVEYDDKFLFRVWSPDYNNQLYGEFHDIGETVSILVSDSASRVRYNFYLLDYVEKYSALIKNATNAWIQVTCEMYLDQGGNLYSSVGNGDSFWYFSHDGNFNIASHSLYNGFVYGECMWSPFDLGALLRNQELQNFEVGIEFENTLNTNNQYLIETFIRSFTATIYLQGVNGTDADQFIVISNGLADIESAVNNVRDEVKKMQGQLDNIDNSINQGFDQIGDQIGDVQEDINTGFGNVSDAINGSGADTSGMDNGMAQLGGQLGDLGEVEDQLGGLIMDKVELPDLIMTNDQSSAIALLVSCLNLAYVDLADYQIMFAAVFFFGIVGVLLFGRRNL